MNRLAIGYMGETPQQLGKYRLQRELGRGGMGVVYEAEDTELARRVALKCLAPALSADPLFVERFRREAQAIAALSHPGIVRIHNFGLFDGQLCIDMELVEGVSLRMSLEQRMSSAESLIGVLVKALDALCVCHDLGIVHRDMKPSNILITPNGNIKLVDFGLATAYATYLEDTLRNDETASVFWGTARYAPPEAWEGAEPSPSWDVYSLGVMLYEGLAGISPYEGTTPFAIARKMAEGEPEPLATILPGVSGELSEFVARCISHTPDTRPRDAREALEELVRLPESEAATGGNMTAPLIKRRWSRLGRRLRRRSQPMRRLAGVLGLLALAVAICVLIGLEIFGRATDVGRGTEVLVLQQDLVARGIPTEEALLQACKSESSRNCVVFDSVDIETGIGNEANWLLVEPSPSAPGHLLGFDERKLVSLTIGEHDGSRFELSGAWLGFERLTGTGLRFGEISGVGLAREDRSWALQCSLDEMRTGARSKFTLDLRRSTGRSTDTRFAFNLERHPYAQSLLSSMLPAPAASVAGSMRGELPALAGARLHAHRVRDEYSPIVDGVLDDAVWKSLDPASQIVAAPLILQAMLGGTSAGNGHTFSLILPQSDTDEILCRVGLLPSWGATLDETAKYFTEFRGDRFSDSWIEIGGARLEWESNWTWAAALADNDWNAELHIAPVGRGPFNEQEVAEYRMNVQLFKGGPRQDRQLVACWGWPEFSKVEHGFVVYSEP